MVMTHVYLYKKKQLKLMTLYLQLVKSWQEFFVQVNASFMYIKLVFLSIVVQVLLMLEEMYAA